MLCATHLLDNESFAVLLPDVLVVDKVPRDKYYSFVQLIKGWNETGFGQIMVEREDLDKVENYGIGDIDDESEEPFKSFELKGLVEKPSPAHRWVRSANQDGG